MNREVICFDAVAPARERGLKYDYGGSVSDLTSRSREGAWIEIYTADTPASFNCCRSREGAWIEIAQVLCWSITMVVAPARERGLKFSYHVVVVLQVTSLPRGSVD